MSDILFWWIGCIVFWVGGIALLCGLLMLVVDFCFRRLRDSSRFVRALWFVASGKDMGIPTELMSKSRLMGDSWWFSEDPATMTLIQDLCNGTAVDTARERWRGLRNVKSKTKEQNP